MGSLRKKIRTVNEVLDMLALVKEAFRPVKQGDTVAEDGWFISKRLALKILDEKI